MFPVANNGTLLACISTKQVKELPREAWGDKTVKDIASPCSSDNSIDKKTEAVKALSLMNRSENSRLLVTEGDRLVGVVTLKDLLKFIALKVELED